MKKRSRRLPVSQLTMARGPSRGPRRGHGGKEAEPPVNAEPVRAEAIVLKVNQQSARVRILGEDGQVTFRSGDVWDVAPGQLVTLVIDKQWIWHDDAYASGRIENRSIDAEKLGLVPLPLEGGELEDLRSAYEPYRNPDPYAPLWRKLTAARVRPYLREL